MRRALAILALARAYEVYENEYANDVLPGGRGDDDLPNLPYAVDANRYSDGVSSVSPLTDTAPAIPLHRGAVSDAPAGRRRAPCAARAVRSRPGGCSQSHKLAIFCTSLPTATAVSWPLVPV